VHGARNDVDAKRVAFKIANSPLVKTAIFGKDPNWGRIMASAGAAGVRFIPSRVDIYFDNVCVAKNGVSANNDRDAKRVMQKKRYTIDINLKIGRGNFSVLTKDLTYDYVRINASYKS